MKTNVIPHIALGYNMVRDEWKNWKLEYCSYDRVEILNVIDRDDNGFKTHNLVDLQAQKYTPQMKDKIFFMKGVTVPRIKLKDLAVKYKIRTTTDIDAATVIVGSSNASDKLVKNGWFYTCCKFKMKAFIDYAKEIGVMDDYYYETVNDVLEPHLMDINVQYILTDWRTSRILGTDKEIPGDLKTIFNEVEANMGPNYSIIKRSSSSYFWTISEDNLNFLNSVTGKKIIEQNGLLEVINGDDCTTIDEVTYQNLRNMFESADTDNHLMAMEIMSNCNYKESMLYLALLFFHHYDHQIYYVKAKNHVNFKSLKNYMGVDSYFHTHVDGVLDILKNNNCLDKNALRVIVMDEFKEYFDNNGSSKYIKPLGFELQTDVSEELNFKWTDKDPEEQPRVEIETPNEDTVDSVEENIDTEDTVDELVEKEVLDTAALVQDEDVEAKVVTAIEETSKIRKANGETADSGFDWF